MISGRLSIAIGRSGFNWVCRSGIRILMRGGTVIYIHKGTKYHDLIVFNELDVPFWK
jgi:hypothetical protein